MFKRNFLSSIVLLISIGCFAQISKQTINKGWQFSYKDKWYSASVPGTIHTDLMQHKLIDDPFYRDNEKKLQWVGTQDWEYKTSFKLTAASLAKKNVELVFDGLDTYADVYVNNQLVLQANNMFRQWRVDIKKTAKAVNELRIYFHSAKNKVDAMAKADAPLVLPDNPRVYARKAQYHFGWDWGPILITSGIWKNVGVEAYNELPAEKPFVNKHKVELVQEPDSIGKTFFFRIDGKPIYMKGANYIPSDAFLPRLKKEEYRKILQQAKDANMNMLRVWGGGIYEDDAFYDLCDEMGIYVWQDFMFAGGMVPGDEAFFDNVRKEVEYQIKRLRKHKSIVLWCGNNETEGAWFDWGWQKQFNLHGADSAKVYNDYKRLFRDSLPVWVNRWDGTRPYTSTSPLNGWGHKKNLTEGDSHYWGVWWALEDIEIFEEKTGRFVSEYGMQGMSDYTTTLSSTKAEDLYQFSDVLKVHQKHPTGYQNIQSYLHRYFLDSNKVKNLSVEDYTYITQCMQAYCFKNIIAIHRSKYPVNMGTLLWQLNDCWPVCSWSISDYQRRPKAAWYAVKEAYRDDVLPVKDNVRPINLELSQPHFTIKIEGQNKISITSDVDASYVYLYKQNGYLEAADNYFDLKAGQKKMIAIKQGMIKNIKELKIKSLFDIRQ